MFLKISESNSNEKEFKILYNTSRKLRGDSYDFT
nr:MAG TPA: hypothetical protein [Caudoviricetes sp.]